MRYFLALAFALLVAPMASADFKPSYSCKGNLNSTERAICKNRILAGLDWQMAGIFFRLTSVMSEAEALPVERAQTRWRLNIRDGCGSNRGLGARNT